MSTVTTPRKPRNVKPVTGTCSLVLWINGVPYGLTVLHPHPEVARHALRLKKPDGETYDLADLGHGMTCTCPDFVFNRDGRDPRGCKHICASRAAGLLPPLASADGPEPETTSPHRSAADMARQDPAGYRDHVNSLPADDCPPLDDDDAGSYPDDECVDDYYGGGE